MTNKLLIAAGLLMAGSALAQAEAPEALYLVGTMNEWTVPADGGTGFALTDEDGDGTYSASFELPSGDLAFKVFKSADADWMNPSLYMGATKDYYTLYSDASKTAIIASEADDEACYRNITIKNWVGGTLELAATQDADEHWTLLMTAPGQPVTPEVEPVYDLYLVGAFTGWNINYGMYLTRVGDQIFEGQFKVPGNSELGTQLNNLRFYSELGDWSTGSIGAVATDQNLNFEDGPVTYSAEKGSQFNWNLVNWETEAILKVRADINTMEITFAREEIDYSDKLYLIGSPQGWNINDGSMPCENIGPGLFRITFDNPEAEPIFRFYTELGDWEENSIGSQTYDQPIDVTMGDQEQTWTCYWGKGSWRLFGVENCRLTVTVDLDNMNVTFKNEGTVSVKSLGTEEGAALYYDLLGNRVANPQNGLFIQVNEGKATKIVL